MSDAACRTLANKKVTSGFVINTNNINTNDESIYDMINNHHVASIPSPEPLTSNDIYTATKNIAKCVIGLVEDFENTKKVMNHWYPWITINKEKKAMMIFKEKETRHDLKEDLVKVILKHNQCDKLLYDSMTDIFNKQLKVIHTKETYYTDI
jgi:hypothetical protein